MRNYITYEYAKHCPPDVFTEVFAIIIKDYDKNTKFK